MAGKQKAGDNSLQVQAETVVVGIDEKRVREIVDEKLQISLQDFSNEANQTAMQRNGEFGKRLINRMVDEDVPCEDILSQINAAKSALNRCGQVILEGHIRHCVRDGLEHGDVDKTLDKFTKAVERFANMQ